MPGWENELRLAATVLLNAAALAGAYRFARRRGGGGALQAACDALLIYFVTQYISVALPGVFGIFAALTMSLVALAIAAALWIGAGTQPATFSGRARPPLDRDQIGFLISVAFVIAYAGAHVFDQRYNPPTATDAIVYHIPTAVQWIQTGTLGLYPTWYWNPAATYSPASSSTFMAWLMAPPHNDVFVRFVQLPPLIFIFTLVARLCREFGCSRTLAGLIAAAAALSRPFFSESLIPKDDLFITALFGMAVLSLAPLNLRDRLGPWRVGLSFGMVLACKYTVLLVCPLFLFMLDAPWRAGWRKKHWLIALSTGVVLFAPWYVRNILLTHNPLYPVDVKFFGHTIFPGLFGTERDQQLRSAGGVWTMLGETYHSLPRILIAILVIGWIGALAGSGKSAFHDPLKRACLIGAPVTFLLFVITSPHHEVRYMYPLLLLTFAAVGYALARWVAWEPAQVGIGVALAATSLATGFKAVLAPHVAVIALEAAVVTAVAVPLVVSQARVYAAATISLLLAMVAFVFWSSFLATYYVKNAEAHQESGTSFIWRTVYPAEEPLWTFVRESVPDDANIAIANTFFVYPFQDAALHRRLGYAPVRKGLHDFLHFPRMGETVPGDLIVQRMTDVMNENPDKETWLENLKRMRAEYLVIADFVHDLNPPERRFVVEEPARFKKLFDSPAGAVYSINRAGEEPPVNPRPPTDLNSTSP
jgi:hypothetical protein